MSEANSTAAAVSPLDALLDAERDLDERLAEHRRRAEARLHEARVAAEERLAGERQRLAAAEVLRLEEARRLFDAELAKEMRLKQEELAQTLAALDDLGNQLCERLLAELLLLR